MTTTTNRYPDVRLPAGAIPASDWGDHASALPLWYRACKTGTSRAKQVVHYAFTLAVPRCKIPAMGHKSAAATRCA
jgi:hypothetical protein